LGERPKPERGGGGTTQNLGRRGSPQKKIVDRKKGKVPDIKKQKKNVGQRPFPHRAARGREPGKKRHLNFRDPKPVCGKRRTFGAKRRAGGNEKTCAPEEEGAWKEVIQKTESGRPR